MSTLEARPVRARALPADEDPAEVYLASLAAGSRRTMRQALREIAREIAGEAATAALLDWSALDFRHTAALRARLAERYAPATANKMLAALRSVLRTARRLGQMDPERCESAREGAEPVRGRRLPAGRDLKDGEAAALLEACARDKMPAGRRDAALIAVLQGAGLRRGELCALELGDLDWDAGTLIVRHGKGDRARAVPLPEGTLAALADWLAARGERPGALFCPVTGELRALTTQAVYDILQKRARAAKVLDISPHDFRRTFVGDLLDAGVDLVTVSQLAGHASVATTARYDRRDDRARRKAVSMLRVPYRRRRRSGELPGREL